PARTGPATRCTGCGAGPRESGPTRPPRRRPTSTGISQCRRSKPDGPWLRAAPVGTPDRAPHAARPGDRERPPNGPPGAAASGGARDSEWRAHGRHLAAVPQRPLEHPQLGGPVQVLHVVSGLEAREKVRRGSQAEDVVDPPRRADVKRPVALVEVVELRVVIAGRGAEGRGAERPGPGKTGGVRVKRNGTAI